MVKSSNPRRPRYKSKSKPKAALTAEATIHMAKFLKGRAFKRRAPAAIRMIRLFVKKMMGTEDVRIAKGLNDHVWNRGIAGVPRRIRLFMKRQKSEEEDAGDKLYTIVSFVKTDEFKGLQNKFFDDETS